MKAIEMNERKSFVVDSNGPLELLNLFEDGTNESASDSRERNKSQRNFALIGLQLTFPLSCARIMHSAF